ncbi:MAG: HAAS signaling domain-containing protein [Candidatus Limnocylindrales bacterium]
MTADPLVQDYLGRLEAAAWPLTRDRRAELVDEVRGHIRDALSVEGQRDEATVRDVLERLGRPEEIVSTEVGGGVTAPGPRRAPDRGAGGDGERIGAVEIIAVLLVSLGSFLLPVIGPLVGLFFVWVSRRWTTQSKVIATVLILILAALPVVLLLAVSAGATSTPG